MFDFSCHSAVMRAVWGEMCMNLDKCFCFLSLIPKEQPHNLPLKAEVLPLLCVYFISQTLFGVVVGRFSLGFRVQLIKM